MTDCVHTHTQVLLTVLLFGQPHRRDVKCLDCGQQWEEIPERTVTTWKRKS